MSSSPSSFRSVLRHRPFVLFLAVSNAGNVGYSVYAISIVWLAYSVSHDLFVVGAVIFVEYAAYSGVFLVGPIVDRVKNQRSIFLACYPPMAIAAAGIGFGASRGILTVPALLVLVTVISVLWDLVWAADNAAPGVLLSPDEQFAAQGISQVIGGSNSIAGYAAGGVLILVVGAAGGMYLYAALLVAGTLFALPLQVRPPPAPETSFGESFRDGWRTILAGSGRPLLQLGTVDAVQGFFLATPALFITLLATATFGGSTFAYSLLFVAEVVGGAASGWVFGRWNPRSRVGTVLGTTLAGAAAAVAVAAGAPAILAVEAAAWFALGFVWQGYVATKYAYLRGAFAPGQLARLTSNMWLFPGIASVVGTLTLGALATRADPLEFGTVILVGFAAAAALAFALPGVRQLRF